MKKRAYRVNEAIRVPTIILIDETGKHYGEIPTYRALAIAKEHKLDLVEINPNSKPPIAKIADYGKLKYRESKKAQKARANATKIETKGVRFSPRTEKHDLEVLAARTLDFLNHGHTVALEVRMRGREQAHPELAIAKLEEFVATHINIPYRVDQAIARQGRNVTMVIAKK